MNQPLSFHLGQKQTQSLKQTQRLIMSPQMQQAIHLLQVPVLELNAIISAELEQNPVLEYESERDNDNYDEGENTKEKEENIEEEMDFENSEFEILKKLDEDFREHLYENEGFRPQKTEEESALQSFLESSIQKPQSLYEYLMDQAREVFDTAEDLELATFLIGNFDEKGFLPTPLEEIALLNQKEVKDLENTLQIIQTFIPSGVGAKDLKESLLIQLKRKKLENSLAFRIISKHFDDMLHNRIPLMQKKLSCAPKEIQSAIENIISKLDLHPGLSFAPAEAQPIVPDIFLKVENDKVIININEDAIPGIRLNKKYLKMLEDATLSAGTHEYIKSKISSGKWLLKNIFQRNDTLQRIADYIVKKQKKFFLHSEGKLAPMTMKAIAESLSLHESTIARAVSNKYLHCPKGTFSLRSFFTNAYTSQKGDELSALTVKELVKRIVDEEDKKKPLSDEAISKKVKEQGINCARRTVAKYRYELNLGNASQRKKYG